MFQIHRAHCTGKKIVQNTGPRNDWIWIQVSREDTGGDLCGRLVAQLLGLFKIRNIQSEAGGVRRLVLVQVYDPMNGSSFNTVSGHIRVRKRPNGRDMRIVDIGTVIEQAHIVPAGERQLIVNHRIDLRTFNEIY